MLGYGWAHWDRALRAQHASAVPAMILAWWLLHVGTLWLNAALDQDDGPVLWGRPTAVPRLATPAAYVALITAVGVAWASGPGVALACAGCALLAVAYSHPALALKGHALGGPGINWLGYAVLSPLAGWSLVGVAVDARTAVSWALLMSWVMGSYVLAQVFQADDDAARGYRTLVVVAGPAVTVGVARTLFAVTSVGAGVLAILGWYPTPVLLSLPVWLWVDRWLASGRSDEAFARTAFRRLLGFGLVLMALVTVAQVQSRLGGGPTAGLATPGGWPADRAWVRQRKIADLRAFDAGRTP